MLKCIEVKTFNDKLLPCVNVCLNISGIAQRARTFLIGVKSLTEAHRGALP